MNYRRLNNHLSCACLAAGAALFASVVAMPCARAQDFGSWSSQWLWLDFKKPNKTHGFQFWLDLHERAWGSNFLAIARPGVGYDVSHGITLWAGYAFIPSVVAGTADSERFEHRLWEQFIVNQKVKTVALQGRIRLEQRFRSDSDGVGERLRLFGRAGFFFGQGAEWGWAVWDEALFNLNTTSLWNAGFDQNRAFTGPFFQAKSGVRVEFGYMNFLVNRRDGTMTDSHIAMINLFFLVNPFHKAPAPVALPPPEAAPPPPPPASSPSSSSPAPDQAPPPAEQPPPEQKLDSGLKSTTPTQSALSPNVASDLWDSP